MKKVMRKIIKNVSFLSITVILFGMVFFSGFFVGSNGGFSEISVGNLNSVTSASTDADFDPFWKVWNLLEEKYIPASSTDMVGDQEKVWGAISGLVDSYDDPYTIFLPPSENSDFETTIQGEFSGVGMEVGMEDEMLTVVAPLKDTPAEEAGIESGDKILAIDGFVTQKMNIDEAVDMIRGEIGTDVTLTILREGIEEPFEIEITRDKINIPTIDHEIIDDVFVISLYNFSANSADDFRDTLIEFVKSGKDKMILDLRGNPGGFLDASVDIASWFLPAGKIIVTEDFSDGKEKHFRSKGYDIFNENLEMIVLVNRGSASASEIVAGALQEQGVAKLLGTKTFGKGSVQELVPITPETSLKVTIARWLTPNGNSISDGGLSPDIIVDKVPEGIDSELYDYQLEEALRILNK
ncbi:MAG: S41 family peptidase [Bacteriovoracia bacterium]